MKKYILILTILSTISLVGCSHEHTFSDATCTDPKICTECQEIEGTALEHNWLEATTENPKTCSLCGLTEGKALEVIEEAAADNGYDSTLEDPTLYDESNYTQDETTTPEEEAPTEEYTLEQKKKELQELGVDISDFTDAELNSLSTDFILMLEGVSKGIYEAEVQKNTTHIEGNNNSSEFDNAPIMQDFSEQAPAFGENKAPDHLAGGTME